MLRIFRNPFCDLCRRGCVGVRAMHRLMLVEEAAEDLRLMLADAGGDLALPTLYVRVYVRVYVRALRVCVRCAIYQLAPQPT